MRTGIICAAIVAAIATLGLPADASAQGKAAEPKAAAAPAGPIDLNTATVAQLDALPGIGAKTAQLIVEHREKQGRFKKIEELMNIKGIGEKAFLKLKPMITIGPEKPGDGEKA